MEEDRMSFEDSSNLSPKQEKKRLNILKITFYVLFILCLALSLYSWNTWKQTDSKTLLAIVLTCLITKIGCVLGLLGSFRTIQDLKLKKSTDQALGHQILIIAFYFLILEIVLFLIFGTRALFYSDRSIAYLNAKFSSNHSEWELRYGSKSIEDIENWAMVMTNVVGYTSYIIVVFILVIIHLLMDIAVKYDIMNTVLALVSLVILMLSGGIVYILVYAVRFKQLMDFEISYFMIVSNIGLAFGLLLASVNGYLISITDKLKHLTGYLWICLLTACIALVSCKYTIGVSRDLVKNLGPNCFDFMAMVGQEYISTLGCGAKYYIESNSTQPDCPKTQQRYIWEEKGKYGCLNPLCCEILITDSKAKFDYLAICSVSSVVVLMVALWTSFYLYTKPRHSHISSSQFHKKIFVALILFSAGWVYLISFKLPPVPSSVPYKNPGVKVSNSGIIDQRLLGSSYCMFLDPLEISSEKCDECLKTEFSFVVDGKGIVNPEGEEVDYFFKTADFEKIKEIVSKTKVCPLSLNDRWETFIEKTDFYKNGESYTVKTQKTIRALDSSKTVKLFGKVYKDSNPFETLVTASGFGLALESRSKYGEYSFEVPYPAYHIPYSLNITYSSDQSTIHRIFKVGGIPADQVAIPATNFLSGSSVSSVRFFPYFLNTNENQYSVEIRRGHNAYSGPFIQSSDFIKLEKGVYSLIALSQGFKSDQREVLVDKNLNISLVFIPEKMENDEAYFVVNWEGEVFLDFKVSFILNEDVYCEVSYVNRVCGGVRLVMQKDNGNSGFTVIRIKPIGAYQYFFYATMEKKTDFLAEVKAYVPGFVGSVFNFQFGSKIQKKDTKAAEVWAGFCVDGLAGIGSVKKVDAYVRAAELFGLRGICKEFYGEVKVFPSGFLQTFQVHKTFSIPKNITK